jgi:hypothetical protein
MSQNLETVKENEDIDSINDPKNIDNSYSPLKFDLLLDPLSGSWFKLPSSEDLGVKSLSHNDSSIEISSFLAKPTLNNIISTSSDS